MKKFNVVVTIRQEYEVEIDETLYNEEWQKDFENSFWDLPEGLESVAKDLAYHQALNKGDFQEGYGTIMVNGQNPVFGDSKPVNGLNVITIAHDEDIEYDITELL